MRCPNCGQETNDTNSNCSFCGSSLSGMEAQKGLSEDSDFNKEAERPYYIGESGIEGHEGRSLYSRRIVTTVISVFILLILLFFAYLFYRNLIKDNNTASNMFQEKDEDDAPLLLPSFVTEPPGQSSTAASIGSVDSSSTSSTPTGSSSDKTSDSTASTTTTSDTTTSFSIRVVVNSDPIETTKNDNYTSMATTGIEEHSQTTVTVSRPDSGTAGNSAITATTADTTTSGTTSSNTSTGSTTTTTRRPPSFYLHIVPDVHNYPSIKLYYRLYNSAEEDEPDFDDYNFAGLRIWERLNEADEWTEQSESYFKESSNICILTNFGLCSASTMKEALYGLIDEMQLDPSSPDDLEKENDLYAAFTAETDPDDPEDDIKDPTEPVWDKFSLINYGDSIVIESPMTDNYLLARRAIRNSTSLNGERSLLHDSMHYSLMTCAAEGQGTVFVITDGRYSGNAMSLEKIEELAQDKSVAINIIYIRDLEAGQGTDEDLSRHSEQTLRGFARRTGGDLTIVEQDNCESQLGAAFLSALNREKDDTFLCYDSSFAGEDDVFHYIRMEYQLLDPEDKIITITAESEYMPPQQTIN